MTIASTSAPWASSTAFSTASPANRPAVSGEQGAGSGRYREFDEAEQLSREVGMRQRVLATAVDQTRRSRQVDFERRASDGTDANGDALVARLAAEAEVARVAYEKKRDQALSLLFDSLPVAIVPTPTPEVVISTLKRLGGTGNDGALARRPLFIDFLVFNPSELIVFLFPIWKGDPAPLMRKVKLEGAGLAEDAKHLAQLLEEASEIGRDFGARERFDRKFTMFLEHLGRLFEPLNGIIQKFQPTEVILSPHAHLESLPLHAAIFSGKALIERYPVVYLPTPFFLGETHDRTPSDSDGVVLVGNPLGDLIAAEQEVEHIARIVREHGREPTVLLRNMATTHELIEKSGTARILHLACHSSHDTEDLLRSGWELYDRHLSVLDVMVQPQLQNAALVFLNSCESSKPRVRLSDEGVSLTRGFLFDGKPAVIGTLWSLGDQAGYCFAETFYQSFLAQNQTLAESFQTAMLKTKATFPSAVSWAPFVARGPWNVTMKRR